MSCARGKSPMTSPRQTSHDSQTQVEEIQEELGKKKILGCLLSLRLKELERKWNLRRVRHYSNKT